MLSTDWHYTNGILLQVFLDDMANFAEMNAEYEKWFTHKPARTCVAVKTLPKGVPVRLSLLHLLFDCVLSSGCVLAWD